MATTSSIYAVHEVASKLPTELRSLGYQKSTQYVLVGSVCGNLVLYFNTGDPSGAPKFGIRAVGKGFEKSAVDQIVIVDPMQLLFCVSDFQLTVHELVHSNQSAKQQSAYPTVGVLRTKPIYCFAVHQVPSEDFVLVAVSTKKKIQIYKVRVLEMVASCTKFKDSQFTETSVECFPYFADNPLVLTWWNGHLAYAVKNEYHFAHLEPNDDMTCWRVTDSVVMVANSSSPLILAIESKQLLGFAKDHCITTLAHDAVQKQCVWTEQCRTVSFSATPLKAAWDSPFLIALLPRGVVEVWTLLSKQHIETIKLNNASYIANGPPFVREPMPDPEFSGYVAIGSRVDVWLLDCHRSLRANVANLINHSRYQLAIELVETYDIFTDDHKNEIKKQYALHLFNCKEFDECFNLLSQVQIYPLEVIQLIPELVPCPVAKVLPSTSGALVFAALPENEKRRAISALANYLSSARTALAIKLDKQTKRKSTDFGRLSEEEIEEVKNTLQIVDTTLLRCYIRTKPIMVDSLLRLRDNQCAFADAEALLQKEGLLKSLFVLYETRRRHELALELLKIEAHKHEKDPFFVGVYKTVDYLQTLGNTDLVLILKYAKWVLEEDLEIFTSAESSLAANLDREVVVNFLKKECAAALIFYLEHIINVWQEQRPMFHDCLVEFYVSKVKTLHRDYTHIFPDDDNIIRAGSEDGELGVYRRKLLRFLETSKAYTPENILVQFNNQAFYEERALIFGRLGRHEQALTIYTSILHDYDAAEKYCELYYTSPHSSDIYLQLFKAYISPKDPQVLTPGPSRRFQIAGLSERDLPTPQPNVREAIRLLSSHASKIDPVYAISHIPDSTSLQSLSAALSVVLQTTHDESVQSSLRRRICESALQNAEERLLKARNVRLNITASSGCSLCEKKLGKSAVVRSPSGTLMHVFCYEKSLEPK